jgi:hypothetical protein
LVELETRFPELANNVFGRSGVQRIGVGVFKLYGRPRRGGLADGLADSW